MSNLTPLKTLIITSHFHMNLQFERIRSVSHRHLHALLPFYVETFPIEERRDTSSLLRMLNETDMYFTAVLADDQLAGMVVYWKFEKYLYIEHLAVFPAHRRKGIGENILKKLGEEGYPVLLEVEIPYDEEGTNRVAFYHRCGFHSLPVYYQQPPYRKGDSVVPMMLFSDFRDWDAGLLDRSIEQFHQKVYYRKEN